MRFLLELCLLTFGCLLIGGIKLAAGVLAFFFVVSLLRDLFKRK